VRAMHINEDRYIKIVLSERNIADKDHVQQPAGMAGSNKAKFDKIAALPYIS
jgi:hypothetical protein